MKSLRLRDISVFSLGEIENKKILDIGCGYGLYSLTFLKLGAKEVCGQDILEDVIKINAEKCNREGFDNFTGKVGDCANLQFEESTFDLIFSGDVFEHITDIQKQDFINEAFRVLKPGGFFTIKTPNLNYLKLTNFSSQNQSII